MNKSLGRHNGDFITKYMGIHGDFITHLTMLAVSFEHSTALRIEVILFVYMQKMANLDLQVNLIYLNYKDWLAYSVEILRHVK